MRTGLFYALKGDEGCCGYYYTLHLHYIEVPLLWKFSFNEVVHLLVGPAVSILVAEDSLTEVGVVAVIGVEAIRSERLTAVMEAGLNRGFSQKHFGSAIHTISIGVRLIPC